MAGLVTYASSDEEDDGGDHTKQILRAPNAVESTAAATSSINGSLPGTSSEVPISSTISHLPQKSQTNGPASTLSPLEPEAPLVGPARAPPLTDIETINLLEEEDGLPPQSPYSANRAMLRDLTLPTVPNYEIPPSPPGSPLASTQAKFKTFLDLKKQGIHFNKKLANSSALKNPSLMQKLMDFSDIDEAGQYATTLPKDLWNPGSFPEYAYKEELAQSQQKILKRKEEEKLRGPRESVDFVPAFLTEPSSRSGTPGAGGKGSQKSTAERIMAGLDRGRSSSPQVAGTKRKTRFDS